MLLKEYSSPQKYLAEAIGTFFLVLLGTGAIIVHQVTGGIVSHVGICLVWGFVVTALIYALGHVSGAHMNPAVTLAFFLSGRFPLKQIPSYWVSQLAGAFAASFLLAALFPENIGLGGTLPLGTPWRSFVLEILLSLLLMLVILQVSTGSKEVGMFAGLAIGLVVLLEALFAGPITGASMNPVRSLAPAIVSGKIQHLWIYFAGPISGMALAVLLWRLMIPQQSRRPE
jgi:aquaporin NIP